MTIELYEKAVNKPKNKRDKKVTCFTNSGEDSVERSFLPLQNFLLIDIALNVPTLSRYIKLTPIQTEGGNTS